MKKPFGLRSIKIAIITISFSMMSIATSMAYDPGAKVFGWNAFHSIGWSMFPLNGGPIPPPHEHG